MKNEDDDFGWGVVVNFSKKSNVKVKYAFTLLEKYVSYQFCLIFRKLNLLFSLWFCKTKNLPFHPKFRKKKKKQAFPESNETW